MNDTDKIISCLTVCFVMTNLLMWWATNDIINKLEEIKKDINKKDETHGTT